MDAVTVCNQDSSYILHENIFVGAIKKKVTRKTICGYKSVDSYKRTLISEYI
jgi:hypothetical protein